MLVRRHLRRRPLIVVIIQEGMTADSSATSGCDGEYVSAGGRQEGLVERLDHILNKLGVRLNRFREYKPVDELTRWFSRLVYDS